MNLWRTAIAGAAAHATPLAAIRGAALFHSTPVHERKRKTYWNSGSSKWFNYHGRRKQKLYSKRMVLPNMSEYAEQLFQCWRDDQFSPSMEDTSWFRNKYWHHERKKNSFFNRRTGNIVFESCSSNDDDDDVEVETIFESIFGGKCYSFRSFSSWQYSSSRAKQRNSSYWKDITDDENDDQTESELASERRALGLSPSGPLKLEEVKSAYRACAFKWHPDRHQGSSKLAAEEKFKNCTAAYELLCDSLVPS